MKGRKVALLCLLGCLLLPVILVVLVLLLFFCLLSWKYGPPLHQSYEEIIKIELLDTHAHDEVILYTLEDSEVEVFMKEFESMKFDRYITDPATHYGTIAVKITYQDGWYDIIGRNINSYCTPEGKNTASDGWYYVSNDEELFALFHQYVDPALVPEEMISKEEYYDKIN